MSRLNLPTTLYKGGDADVYPHPGPPVKGKSTSIAFLDVNNEDELNAALADGWHKTVPRAVGLPDAPAPSSKSVHELVRESAYASARQAGRSEEEAEAIAKAAADAADPPKKKPAPHLADVSGEDSDSKVVDLKALDVEDLKAIAKDLPGFDGRMGKDKLIALIEKAKG